MARLEVLAAELGTGVESTRGLLEDLGVEVLRLEGREFVSVQAVELGLAQKLFPGFVDGPVELLAFVAWLREHTEGARRSAILESIQSLKAPWTKYRNNVKRSGRKSPSK